MTFRQASPNNLMPLLGTYSMAFQGAELNGIAPGSAVWPAANRAIFLPFYLGAGATAVKVWWNNGTVVSGNVDCAIYRDDLSKIVGCGSTAQAGTSAIQEADITDTYLAPGTYYLALILDNVTGTTIRNGSNIQHHRSTGAFQMATSIPLPATATITALAAAYLPLCGIAFRTLVA